MSSDAIAILGFVVLFVLMLLRVPVGMAMGLVGVSGFAYIVGGAGRPQECRPHHHAYGDRLQLRRCSAVSADGRIRHHLRNEPGAVSRRECLSRPSQGRARHRHHRRLRRVCSDLRLVGGDRRDLLKGRLSRNAILRLPPILRHRRDRRGRHARHHDSAFDGARNLRADHRAGRGEALHRRGAAGHSGGGHVHDHHHDHRRRAPRLPAGRPAQFLEGAHRGVARCLGDAAPVRLRHRRHLWRRVHRNRSGGRRRRRRLHHRRRCAAGSPARTSSARCSRPRASPRRCSPC